LFKNLLIDNLPINKNVRGLLRDKYASLLHQQQVYWKQRGTIKWVKFGDEGTQFFMLMLPLNKEEI
jgi:hypothetical protein